MNCLVSVIVPIYNTEKYLKKCVNSLLRQTYTELEIILVNDGSTDNSQLICEKFQKEDKRIIILNKENEGLELARKSGYKIATGKYIIHVDSDDYLPTDAIEVLVCKAEKENADIVIGNATRIIGNKGIIKKIYKPVPECSISRKEMLDKYYISFFGVNILPVSMWGKLYKKEFLEKIEIKNIGLMHGEDICYNIQVFPYAQKIVVIENSVYYYRWGGMTSKMNYKLFDDARIAYRLKLEMLQKFPVEKAECFIAVELKNFLLTYIESFFIYTQKDKKEIEKYISRALQTEEMQDALKKFPEKDKAKEIIQIMMNGNIERLIEVVYPEAMKKKKRRKYKYWISKCLYKFL